MKLASMKVDPKKREKGLEATTVAADAPMYPWGLSINLEEDAIESLGLEELPDAGATVLVYAKATVSNVGVSDSAGSGKRRSLSLQITDLAIAPEATKQSDHDILFGKGKG